MAFPIVPVAVFGLAGVAAWKTKKRQIGMTPEREKIFVAAMKTLEDSVKLNGLADRYQSVGLTREAILLRKKASLRGLPPEKQEARREAFRKGIRCLNPELVEGLAEKFYNEGCFSAANTLRVYASGLRATDKVEIEKIAGQLDKLVSEKNKESVKILKEKASNAEKA